ncbi:unnamed protein product [Linum trigynum]|uniref:Uncharacterized protein n=1 Tax=Linum trigynum TaxID=586398 RepID=A0AAV2CND8_9ROSI
MEEARRGIEEAHVRFKELTGKTHLADCRMVFMKEMRQTVENDLRTKIEMRQKLDQELGAKMEMRQKLD